jgi:hypothetical protein
VHGEGGAAGADLFFPASVAKTLACSQSEPHSMALSTTWRRRAFKIRCWQKERSRNNCFDCEGGMVNLMALRSRLYISGPILSLNG